MADPAMPAWDQIREFLKDFGLLKGAFTIFFFAAHIFIFYLYKAVIEGRQQEIDRLADDNHKYRDYFMKQLDNRQKKE